MHSPTLDLLAAIHYTRGFDIDRLLVDVCAKVSASGTKLGGLLQISTGERGGNCELTRAGETVEHQGVKILGPLNLAARVPGNASSLYARNLYAFIETLTDKKDKAIAINWDDEIVKGTLIARDGRVVDAYSSMTGPEDRSFVREIEKQLAMR
jgi:NAD(P) transhydrogenase subunit alpha